MNSPWDHTTPIENLFAHMKECQEDAKAGDKPIDNRKIIRVTYMHIKMTGIFNEACDTWDDKAEVNKTWDKFKQYFITAQLQSYQKEKQTHNGGDRARSSEHSHDQHDSYP